MGEPALSIDARDFKSVHDLGKNLIPQMVARDRTFAYPFNGYWADVGTIAVYWEPNLALLEENPALDLNDPSWVIHPRSEERPPVKFKPPGTVDNSLLSNGCIITGTVINSVLSRGVRVERGAVVRDSVIMNDTTIRTGERVHCCILDKGIEIRAKAQVGVGDDNTPNQLEPVNLNTGITIVGKQAHIPAGATIGRNCRIDSNVTPDDFDRMELPSGGTIKRRSPSRGGNVDGED